MKTTYRPALAEEIPAIAELSARTYLETFGYLYTDENNQAHLAEKCSEAYFHKHFGKDQLYLAFAGDTLIGYAKFGALRLPYANPITPCLELERFYIDSSYQGKGAAQGLMDAVMEQMQSAKAIYLGVWEENHRARKFYERYGFTEVGEFTYYVGTQGDRELVYCRQQ